MVGTNLRDLTYAPIVEGRWLGGDPRAGGAAAGGEAVRPFSHNYDKVQETT